MCHAPGSPAAPWRWPSTCWSSWCCWSCCPGWPSRRRRAARLNPAALAAVALTVFVLVVVGYPATIETLSRGRSLGKLALGLRVVSDDGGPERFRQALMRALLAVLEIWLTLGFLALVTSLLSASGKRLGDIFAGTFVITERMPQPRGPAAALSTMPPALAGWAATAAAVRAGRRHGGNRPPVPEPVLRRSPRRPATDFGQRIAAAVAAQVSPPPPAGTTPPDYLSAVLAERRAREQARIMGRVTLGDSGPATAPAAPGSTPAARAGPPGRARLSRSRASQWLPWTAQEGFFRLDDQMSSPGR